jgi:hypothetical protein
MSEIFPFIHILCNVKSLLFFSPLALLRSAFDDAICLLSVCRYGLFHCVKKSYVCNCYGIKEHNPLSVVEVLDTLCWEFNRDDLTIMVVNIRFYSTEYHKQIKMCCWSWCENRASTKIANNSGSNHLSSEKKGWSPTWAVEIYIIASVYTLPEFFCSEKSISSFCSRIRYWVQYCIPDVAIIHGRLHCWCKELE